MRVEEQAEREGGRTGWKGGLKNRLEWRVEKQTGREGERTDLKGGWKNRLEGRVEEQAGREGERTDWKGAPMLMFLNSTKSKSIRFTRSLL